MSQIPTSIQSVGYLFSVLILDHCHQLNIGFHCLPSKCASRASLATEWEKQMYLCKSKKKCEPGWKTGYCMVLFESAIVYSVLCDLEILEFAQLRGIFNASTIINTHVAEKTGA